MPFSNYVITFERLVIKLKGPKRIGTLAMVMVVVKTAFGYFAIWTGPYIQKGSQIYNIFYNLKAGKNMQLHT